MQELLWLLLPVAAFSGWWSARRNATRSDLRAKDCVPSYFQGLNYFLNEQPDKALDLFLENVEVNRETLPTYMAMGNHFRRRGEVDKAIQIHQSLMGRPGINGVQRDLALLELGRDYLSAGLYDRAENIFRSLTTHPEHGQPALRALLEIFQREKSWHDAANIASQMMARGFELGSKNPGHFYCELGDGLDQQGDEKGAERWYLKALELDRDFARSHFALARLYLRRGQVRQAVQAYEKALKCDINLLPMVLDILGPVYREQDQLHDFMHFLDQLLKNPNPHISVVIEKSRCLEEIGRTGEARLLLQEHLSRQPNVRGVHYMASHTDVSSEGGSLYYLMKTTIDRLVAVKPSYQCRQCGFTSQAHYWQCPGCRAWSTTQLIRGIEAE